MKTITLTNTGVNAQTIYQSTGTPTQPTQQVTVGQFPALNPTFSRAVQLSNEFVFVKRGTYTVGISLTDLVSIAATIEPNLSYVPYIITQPANASCVHSSTAATFTLTKDSELAVTYLWQYSTNGGSSWSTASGTVSGCVFTNGTTATLTCTPTTTGLTGAKIRCQVTNSLGTTNTDGNATLTIT